MDGFRLPRSEHLPSDTLDTLRNEAINRLFFIDTSLVAFLCRFGKINRGTPAGLPIWISFQATQQLAHSRLSLSSGSVTCLFSLAISTNDAAAARPDIW